MMAKQLKLPKPKAAKWRVCADEGDACKCSGTVIYGSKSHASAQLLLAEPHKSKQVTGSVMCDNGGMVGDSAADFEKRCWCKPSGPAQYRGERGVVEAAKGGIVVAAQDLAFAVVQGEGHFKEQLEQVLTQYGPLQTVLSAIAAEDYAGALEAAHATPSANRPLAMRYCELLAYMRTNHTSRIYSTSTQLLQHTKVSAGDWKLSEPHTLAVLAGGMAALQLANLDKATKLYQHVLRLDPDQKEIKQAYKAIKNFKNHMKEVDDSLHLSFNHKAVQQLQQATGMLQGMGIATGGVHSMVMLKRCDALSAMKEQDDAIEACDMAIEMIGAPVNGADSSRLVDPSKLSAAYKMRAEAHLKDNDFEEAVDDLRTAVEHASQHARGDLEQQLRQAQQGKDQWEKRRDHKIVLDVPSNIGELTQADRCMWLKKMYKKMAMRWHPDKARGSNKRAERKMRECAEAKETLVKRWGCKGIR